MRKKNRGRKRKRRNRKQSKMGVCRRVGNSCSEAPIASESNDTYGFQTGPDFTFKEFQQYADAFKDRYFRLNDANEDGKSSDINHQERWEPSVDKIEGEYWRIIEKSTDDVEVLFIVY